MPRYLVARRRGVGDDRARLVVDDGSRALGAVFLVERLTPCGFLRRALHIAVESGDYGIARIVQGVARYAEHAAHLFRRRFEIKLRARAVLRALFDLEFLALCRVALLFADMTLSAHDIEHGVSSALCGFEVAERGVARRIFDYASERRRLGQTQFLGRAVEIQPARRSQPVSAAAEVDDIEVHGENVILRIGALDLARDGYLVQLAPEGARGVEVGVFHELLGDGGAPFDHAAAL